MAAIPDYPEEGGAGGLRDGIISRFLVSYTKTPDPPALPAGLAQPRPRLSQSMTHTPPRLQDETTPDARPRVAERVAGVLSERIRSGVYGAGEPLPTERTLAADLGVHRRSVRTAVEQLIRDGLVSQRPNCRPTVGRSAPEASAPRDRLSPSRISASNLIALIMWHGGGPLEHAGSSQQRIFWGMNQSLMRLGYHAVFLDLGGERIGSEEENAAREAEHLRYIRDQGFGGALFYPYAYRHNHDLVREVSRSVPIVLLDRKIPGADVDFVGIENHGAMAGATEHLIAQGHRRIAYLTRLEPIHSVQDRIQGYLAAMRGADASEVTEMVVTIPPYSDDRYWTLIDAVFRLPPGQRPTAAVCVNDYVAVGLAERLEYLGLSTPTDVALTGFDDIVPTLPNGTGLTTVAQPYEEIGASAVGLLMRRIQDRRAPTVSLELPAKLVVRASSMS
jgi:DNA-binding LacI/PurR family transcriptional regulator/DNA-binding transcriptional regulator YhcF (GntR family)